MISGSYAGLLSGNGSLGKRNLGVLTLEGISRNFMGSTTVTEGILNVVQNARLGGSVQVIQLGTLSGGGTVGSTTVDNQGTVSLQANDNLKIAGDLTFDAG